LEYFTTAPNARYEGPDSKNPFAFKYYDPDEKIGEKTASEWLRFAVAYWHTFTDGGADPFGAPTLRRPWNQAPTPIKAAEQRLDAAFEFFEKLGVDYYCFHDFDLAPEGETLAESYDNLDRIATLALEKQKQSGVKLLWGTANLFSHPRYAAGAATNPDPAVFAHAAAQVKKAMETTKMLGGENYVFWGGREGYESILNTDMKREQEHLARFLELAADHAREIGFEGRLLIEPKPKEPTKHQYDFDAATVIGFLDAHGLADKFKLNVEANHATLAGHEFAHDLAIASARGMLGSIDANRGDLLLGWDTDQFPTSLADAVHAMIVVLRQGGIAPGGLNFDAKVRRSSVDLDDLFYAHIGGMDAFALGLKIAKRILDDGVLDLSIRKRYAGWDSALGEEIESGKATFESLAKRALEQEEPTPRSGEQEKLENIFFRYLINP
jgi:xylose isomerase